MITVTVSQLESKTINALIDDNIRFTIVHEDVNEGEEDNVDVISDKVAVLREQYLRDSE